MFLACAAGFGNDKQKQFPKFVEALLAQPLLEKPKSRTPTEAEMEATRAFAQSYLSRLRERSDGEGDAS